MISEKEIQAFWNRWDIIMISWFLVSLFGFPLLPFAYILKYKFGVKGLWLLNDTVDGDFGDPDVLKEYGRSNKSKLSNFIWWWFRNHSWNYISKFNPEWEGGKTKDFLIIKTTLTREQILNNPFQWCTKKGVHGLHYIAYRINGKVYCRYSEANAKRERIFGAGGDRFKLKIR